MDMTSELKVHTIDHLFGGVPHAIASFIVPTDAGLILIESGPHSTLPNLKNQIESLGYTVKDIHTVLLTHIHLDHAGAAWYFAKLGANVYVHHKGYRHLKDPNRLMSSAKMIYKDQMDALWGKMESIDESLLHEVDDNHEIIIDGLKIKAIYTPGHAKHHVSWRINDAIFTGDVAGVAINGGPAVPPCPPPDIDIELWQNSIARLKKEKGVRRFFLTHFGMITDVEGHLDDLSHCIDEYAKFIFSRLESGMDDASVMKEFGEMVFKKYEANALDAQTIASYEAANPAAMSIGGLIRYWNLKNV